MRNCFVPGCDKKAKHLGKLGRPMFLVPKDKALFAKWAEAVPQRRALKSCDRICSLHFQPHEIEKCFQHIINGQLYQLDRDRVRLKANAVPSQNLPSAEEIVLLKQRRKLGSTGARVAVAVQAKTTTKEKQSTVEETQDAHTSTHKEMLIEEVFITETAPATGVDTLKIGRQQRIRILFNKLHDEIYEVVLPSTLWGIHRCPLRSIIVFSYMDTVKLQSTKMLTIDSNGVVRVFLACQLVNTMDVLRDAPTTEAITELLTQLDETHICASATTVKSNEVTVTTEAERNQCELYMNKDDVLFYTYECET